MPVSGDLDRRLAEIEQREQEQARWVADVSHELRTPLTILRGVIEVALEGERTADEYRQALSEALVEIQHLVRISENLLFLARGMAGRVTMTFERIDLPSFVAEVAGDLLPAAREKGLTLECEPSPERAVVLGDRNRLRQVFQNLLENAVRYTERGGVRVAVRSEGDRAVATVTDSGVGIDRKDLPFIFDRFFRSDRARRAYKGGSGLGLSIVRWIVEAHKASISVDSAPGRGTTFTLAFPKIA